MKHVLMPLPKPAFTVGGRDCYDMNQMRAFALDEAQKAVAAERERCAKVCEGISLIHAEDSLAEPMIAYSRGMSDGAYRCSKAIRVTPNDKQHG